MRALVATAALALTATVVLAGCAATDDSSSDAGTPSSASTSSAPAANGSATSTAETKTAAIRVTPHTGYPDWCEGPNGLAEAVSVMTQEAKGAGAAASREAAALLGHKPAFFKSYHFSRESLLTSFAVYDQLVAYSAAMPEPNDMTDRQLTCETIKGFHTQVQITADMLADAELMSALPAKAVTLSSAQADKWLNTRFVNFFAAARDRSFWPTVDMPWPLTDDAIKVAIATGAHSPAPSFDELVQASTYISYSCAARMSGAATSCRLDGFEPTRA